MAKILKEKIGCNFKELHEKLMPGDAIEIVRKSILGIDKFLIMKMSASKIGLSGNISIERGRLDDKEDIKNLYFSGSTLKITEIYRLYRV